MNNNKGLYIYCIRKKIQQKFSSKGIDGREDIFSLPYKDLEAIVSKISLEEFDSEEIAYQAQQDVNWIKEKAIIHEAVIEETMMNKIDPLAVIPLKFGTIFDNSKKIQQLLERHYTQFEKVLQMLAGKQEWAVKVYLEDRKKFEENIRNSSETLKTMEKETYSLPKGVAYFMRKQMQDRISSEVSNEIEKYSERFFLALDQYAALSKKMKILATELTGKHADMIFNASFLIQKENITSFKNEISRQMSERQPQGFQFQYSGPWPTYNFTKLEEDDSIC